MKNYNSNEIIQKFVYRLLAMPLFDSNNYTNSFLISLENSLNVPSGQDFNKCQDLPR